MANRNKNDYNDQDYPQYYDRNDRYDSQSERGNPNRNRNAQRNNPGSGRENVQGGAFDYNQSSGQQSRFGGTGSRDNYEGGNYGREANANKRGNDDFASSSRSGEGGYASEAKRGQRDDRGDYTLYGYDRDQRPADRSGDFGGRAERTSDYSSNYNYSGGSYARSDDDRRPSDGRGGSSRYRGEQGGGDEERQNPGRPFYGQGGDYTGSSEQGFDYQRREDFRQENRFRPARSEQEERGWWEKTTDQVASWLGDDDATQRRERDSREDDRSRQQYRGQSGQSAASHRGRGPKNYRRSDDRIKEDINDRLTDYAYLDASDIDVEVSGGEVILTGTVESRYAKRMAEDIADNASGVTHVENRLRIKNQSANQFTTQTSTQSNNFSSQNQAGFSSSGADSTGTYGSREDLAANYSNLNLSEVSPIAKPVTGDITGTNPEMAAAATENQADLDDESETSGNTVADKPDSTTTFAQRGVDKLEDSTK